MCSRGRRFPGARARAATRNRMRPLFRGPYRRVGRGTDDGSVHDKDNTNIWNTAFGRTTLNRTAFTAFLGTLTAALSSIPAGAHAAAGRDSRAPKSPETEPTDHTAPPA